MTKRILAFVLALCLLLSNAPMPIHAITKHDHDAHLVTNGEAELTLKDGYYEIATADQLIDFASMVNSGQLTINAKLTADVDMTGKSWTPIGNSSKNYQGTFDGQGHIISNLTYSDTSGSYVGLFGYVKAANIKNVTVANANISGYQYVAAVVGRLASGTIENCAASGTIHAFNSSDSYVGGVVSRVDTGVVQNCFNESTVTGNGQYTGGVVGYVNSGITLTNCYNIGTIAGKKYTAGVVGRLPYTGATVSNCYSLGSVIGETAYVGAVLGSGSGLANSYYLTGSAKIGDTVMNGVGKYNATAQSDTAGVTSGKDVAWFASADAVAALNNGGDAWVAGTDYPVLKVFQKAPSGGETPEPECEHKNTEIRGYKAPTCAEAGYSGDTYCTDCGEKIATGAPVDATGNHTYQDACDPSCDDCGATREVGDHNYVDGKCSYCGAEQPGYCAHDWKEATCVDPKTCSKCNATEGEPLGHAWGEPVVTDPTCTEKGTTVTSCTRCNYEEKTEQDALGHDMGAYVQTKEPTCTEKGQETSNCSRCDHKEYRDVPEKGHNFVEGKCTGCGAEDPDYDPGCDHEWDEATCDKPKTCSKCGSTEGQSLGHELGEYVQTTDPGCDTLGLQSAKCIRCEYTKTRYVKAKGHNAVDGVCQNCDKKVGTSENPAMFAIGDNFAIASTTAQEKHYYFVFCAPISCEVTISSDSAEWRAYINIYDFEGNAQGAQTTHKSVDGAIVRKLSAGQKIVVKISNYSGWSAVGGEITVNFQFTTACAHSFVTDGKEATCEADGCVGYTCSICGEGYAENVPAKGHTEEIIPGKDPTCTEPGMTEGKKCAVCDHVFVAQTEIPENGHTPGEPVRENVNYAGCTESGSYDEVVYCAVCEEELSRTHVTMEVVGHTEEIIPGKAATCTEPGMTDGKKCSVCGETIVAQEVISPLGHTEETVPGKAATCTEPGMTDGKKCTVCGVVTVAQEETSPLGHTEETVPGKDATCTEPGLTEGKKCGVCGETIVAQEETSPLGHTEVAVPGKNPTCTEPGLTDGKKCSVCEEFTQPQTTIPATGHNYVGDACTKCGDDGEELTTGMGIISGQLYVYTAQEDVLLNISVGSMQDSAGKYLWTWVDDGRVEVLLNGVPMVEYNNKDFILKAGQTVKLLMQPLDEYTYTATVTLEESDVQFLELGENTLLPGVTYAFSAQQTGKLYLSAIKMMAGEVELDSLDSVITIQVNKSKLTDFNAVYDVAEGDTIVVTMSASAENATADIWLSHEKAYDHPVGSKKNPAQLPFANCPESTLQIAAGGTVWYNMSGFKHGYVLHVTGENAYILVGDTRHEAVNGVVTLVASGNGTIQIGNAGEQSASFAMETAIPVGHADNPATLTGGEHTVDIPAGGEYVYQFTATEPVRFQVAVSGDDYWRFFLSHSTADGTKVLNREDHRGDRGDINTVELLLQPGDTILLELTTYRNGNIGGAVTVDASVRSIAQAQINGVNYKTLKEAIAAAQDGDVIVLLNDVAVSEADCQILGGKYTTIFKVEGKRITIDLNGMKIYGDAAGMTEMLVGMFATDNNGHLTLKDSVGTGTVQIDANGANVYALIVNYEGSSSITIEGGNYILDVASDSLVYTHGNECIQIYGGNFRLGNVGTGRNQSPWIFNAKGQNTAHVLIYGGTFNADVQHQYWLYESEVVKEKALVKSADADYGTIYTIVDAVCYVTERHFSGKWYTQRIGYASLQEAVDACVGVKIKLYYNNEIRSEPEVIVLLTDIVLEQPLEIAEGKMFTLDLNGKTISQSKECTGQYAMITNHSDLIIMDSVGGGKISFTDTGMGDATYGWGSYTIANFGNLTVKSGTIEHLGQQPFGNHMIFAIYQGANPKATTTIEGGKISTPSFRAMRICSGKLVITGGTFDGQVWVDPQMEGVCVTITDGNFHANGTDEKAILIGDRFEVEQNISVSVTENEIDFGNISVPSIGGGKKPVKKP